MKTKGWDTYMEIRRLGKRISTHRCERCKLLLEVEETQSRYWFTRWLFWTCPHQKGAIITIDYIEIAKTLANTESWTESYIVDYRGINELYEKGVLYIPIALLVRP